MALNGCSLGALLSLFPFPPPVVVYRLFACVCVCVCVTASTVRPCKATSTKRIFGYTRRELRAAMPGKEKKNQKKTIQPPPSMQEDYYTHTRTHTRLLHATGVVVATPGEPKSKSSRSETDPTFISVREKTSWLRF